MMALLIGIASPLPAVADLSWMAGYWLACSARGETAETWTDDRGGVLLGLSKSVRDGRARWEFSRIDQHGGAVTFFANPEGQSPTAFKASSVGSDKVVFENAGHDFPQRVIYERTGDQLTGRIEGRAEGKLKVIEWHFDRADLNATCSPARK